MGLLFNHHSNLPDSSGKPAEAYMSYAKDKTVWYGLPVEQSMMKQDRLEMRDPSKNYFCNYTHYFDDGGSALCSHDNFLHIQSQAISPQGIVHASFYEMPIIGAMFAVVFVGIMSCLKLKTKLI